MNTRSSVGQHAVRRSRTVYVYANAFCKSFLYVIPIVLYIHTGINMEEQMHSTCTRSYSEYQVRIQKISVLGGLTHINIPTYQQFCR